MGGSLIYRTEPKMKTGKNTENKQKTKRIRSEEAVRSRVREVSPEEGKESVVGRICETGRQ